MKNAEFERLAKRYILPDLPGFTVKGKLIFEAPIGLILNGIIFQPSGWDKEKFRVEVFIQPLYIPYDSIIFLFGYDLCSLRNKVFGQHWWKVDAGINIVMTEILQRILADCLDWFGHFTSPVSVVNNNINTVAPTDPHLLRAIAYSWIMCDNRMKADETIGVLLDKLYSYDPSDEWVNATIKEVSSIRELLLVDSVKAKEQLLVYRKYTIEKLRLDKWAIKRDELQLGIP